MMLLAAMFALQSGALPAITMTPLANGGKLHAENFPEAQAQAVTQMMMERATAHCGKLKVRWGRFDHKMDAIATAPGQTTPIYRFYDQKFSCYDPATDPYKAAPADWKPDEKDKTDALISAERHLAAMDRGDVPRVIAGFEPILELSDSDAKATVDDYRSRTKGQTRSFRPLAWGNNLEGAAHPGAYAYAVFDGPRSCGYLLLYRAAPGQYFVSQFRVFGQIETQPWTAESKSALDEQCGKL